MKKIIDNTDPLFADLYFEDFEYDPDWELYVDFKNSEYSESLSKSMDNLDKFMEGYK